MDLKVEEGLDNMNIDIRDTITLNDDNKYVVVSKIDYDDDTYYYLTDINNNENTKFLVQNRYKQESLLEVEDIELLQKLFPMFLSKTKEIMDIENI